MARLGWFILSLALAAVAGYALADQMPAIVDNFTDGVLNERYLAILSNPLVITNIWLAGAGICAIVLAIAGLGLVDGLATHKALERVRNEQPSSPEALAASLEDMPALAGPTADYVATLHGDKPPFLATQPAERFFAPRRLVEQQLFPWFAANMPLALLGLGLVSFAWFMIAGFDLTTSGGRNIPPNATMIGLICLTVSGGGALVAVLIRQITLDIRRSQVERLCAAIDHLFTPYSPAAPLEQLARTRDIIALHKDLTRDLQQMSQETVKAIESTARSTNKAIMQTLEDALATPLKDMASTTRSIAQDQSDHVERLLTATLDAFLKEMSKKLTSQINDLKSVLKSVSDMGRRTEKSFSEATTALVKQNKVDMTGLSKTFQTALATLEKREARERKEISSELSRFAKALEDQVKNHSDSFSVLLRETAEKVDEVSRSAVAHTGADLQSAAASFEGLHTVVENLVTLVAPTLRQVIENQESLLAALDEESRSSKVLGRAASELGSAAQASRETVERFIALAERMRETSNAIRDLAGAGTRPAQGPSRAAAPSSPSAITPEISAAIKSLRHDSDEDAKALPKL